MSFVGEVGDAVQTRGEMTYEWKISDFLSLPANVDDYYHSPVFSFEDVLWYLRLYPNGRTEDSGEYWVCICLMRGNSGPPKTVYCTFGIKGSDGVEKTEEIKGEFSEEITGFGFYKWWTRPKLRNRKPTLLPNKMLAVICDLGSDVPCRVKGETKLVKSLRSVLESADDSDVLLKVHGKEFPAHRVILRARSSVFRSMFTHDMVEKQTNVVTIEDCDPETFPDFLLHIYSGSCEQISTENVLSLYTAADKYDVGELKEACAEFMKTNFNVACFCDIITLAVMHNEKELIECATKFFCENSLEIVKTVQWPIFLVENVTVGNELVIKAQSK